MLHGFQKIRGYVRFQFPETFQVELYLPFKTMYHSRFFSLDQGSNLFLVFFKQFEVSLEVVVFLEAGWAFGFAGVRT